MTDNNLYILPFDIMELENLKKMECIEIDMSKTEFPENINNISTTFVYLRNIGLSNIKLNFSKCDYETKAKYLKEYISTKFEIKQKEFSDTLIKVVCEYYKGIKETIETYSFLNTMEIDKFINENLETVKTISNFLVSLPLYQIMRLELEEDTTLDMTGINSVDTEVMGANIYNFLEDNIDIVGYVFAVNPNMDTPNIYTKYFTKDNERLIYVLKDSITNTLLYCIANHQTELFNNIYEISKEMGAINE